MIQQIETNKKKSNKEYYEDEILLRRVYRHYKGDLVTVLGIAKIEGKGDMDGKEMVIFANLNNGEMRLREKSTWFDKHPETQEPRYVLGEVFRAKLVDK